jgi:hypothetical protein
MKAKLMKILLISIQIVAVILILKSCNSPQVIPPINSGVVTDVLYIHDLPAESVLEAESLETLLELVRVTIVQDASGHQTVFIGETSDENSRIFYLGIEGEDLVFQLVPGGRDLTKNPDPDWIRRFPKGS